MRGADAELAALLKARAHGVYVVGGRSILQAQAAAPDPLFSPEEARALGVARETVFSRAVARYAALRHRHGIRPPSRR